MLLLDSLSPTLDVDFADLHATAKPLRGFLGERRRILMTMLDTVYIDLVEETQTVAIGPTAPFRPVFQVVDYRGGLFSPPDLVVGLEALGLFAVMTP